MSDTQARWFSAIFCFMTGVLYDDPSVYWYLGAVLSATGALFLVLAPLGIREMDKEQRACWLCAIAGFLLGTALGASPLLHALDVILYYPIYAAAFALTIVLPYGFLVVTIAILLLGIARWKPRSQRIREAQAELDRILREHR